MDKGRRPVRLLLTGGGTGGHLFPAIAAAEELCTRLPDSKVMFIGTRRRMDATHLIEYGYEVKGVHCYGLKGKSIIDLVKALAILPIAVIEAIGHILSFRPDVVLGVGGYVTGPVMVAAKLLGRKTVIHEQNSIPGLANRKLGRLVDRVCISLPQSAKYFTDQKTVLTGNPVRKAILALSEKSTEKKKYPPKTLLILGGSQGAHRLNQLVSEALCTYGVTEPLHVIHQTGAADCQSLRQKYEENGIEGQVEPFFRNMAEIYERADLLVSRAGATTLAELAVLGKPAILIPFPYAADNHQQKNADYYVAGGGCRSFNEGELQGDVLATQINDLLGDDRKRMDMAECMKKLGYSQAATEIVDVCLGLI